MMKKKLKLRKCIIHQKLRRWEFEVEDVFSEEIIFANVSKLVLQSLKIEDVVYVAVSPFELDRGRIVTSSYFKMNQDLFEQKLLLDKKHAELKKDKS